MSLFPGAGPALPEPRRIDYAAAQKMFVRHKAALTRAKNSGDPVKVLEAVELFIRETDEAGFPWPDSWATWRIALNDAASTLRRNREDVPLEIQERFNRADQHFF